MIRFPAVGHVTPLSRDIRNIGRAERVETAAYAVVGASALSAIAIHFFSGGPAGGGVPELVHMVGRLVGLA